MLHVNQFYKIVKFVHCSVSSLNSTPKQAKSSHFRKTQLNLVKVTRTRQVWLILHNLLSKFDYVQPTFTYFKLFLSFIISLNSPQLWMYWKCIVPHQYNSRQSLPLPLVLWYSYVKKVTHVSLEFSQFDYVGHNLLRFLPYK